MAYKNLRIKTEGGSGGKRGHSNMTHWDRTEIIKEKTARARRQQVRALKHDVHRAREA